MQEQPSTLKRGPAFFPADIQPRVLLLFFAIPLQLLASLLSGIGFSANEGAFWIGGVVLWLAWFAAIFYIIAPGTDNRLINYRGGLKKAAGIVFIIVLAVGIAELIFISLFAPAYIKNYSGNNIAKSLEQMEHGFQYNDGTALCQQAAENLLDGKNPYANANIVQAFIKFNGSYDRVTPLMEGRLATTFPYPTQAQLKTIWDDAVKTPDASAPPEMESRVCYPAGSFLFLAPFLKAGIRDSRWIYFIYVIAGLAYAAWRIPARRRLVFIGLALMSLELWNSLAIGETGALIFPFLLVAWISIGENNWASAFFMGLAVATKQTAWFFLPFYLILMWRAAGPTATGWSIGVMATVFAVMNGYFIALDPSLWLKSITSPMTERMFPIGVGLISFVTAGVLNIRSQLPFSIMEMASLAACIIWYWRYCNRWADSALILAVVPFFFAWRSLWTYFFYLTLILAARLLARRDQPAPTLSAAGLPVKI